MAAAITLSGTLALGGSAIAADIDGGTAEITCIIVCGALITSNAYTGLSGDGSDVAASSGGVSAFVSDNAAVSLEGLYYRFDETIDFGDAGEDVSASLDDAFSVMMKFAMRVN